tara:strand:- start:167 stop:517 length:351 start_codon:yes stop_codon:yes gene_type:complete
MFDGNIYNIKWNPVGIDDAIVEITHCEPSDLAKKVIGTKSKLISQDIDKSKKEFGFDYVIQKLFKNHGYNIKKDENMKYKFPKEFSKSDVEELIDALEQPIGHKLEKDKLYFHQDT